MPVTNKNKLLFVGNELLGETRELLRVPMEFITFAFVEGKLFKHFRNDGTFILSYGKPWGNSVVYGAIFAINDFDFYTRILDSYHQCSLSALGRNHLFDVHHRITTKATPITFASIDELERLKYRERNQVEVQMYEGNQNHPKIKQRLNKTHSYRIVDGVDKNLIKLIREELL